MEKTETVTSADARADLANRVTWVGFFVNLGLTAFKLFAGIFGHSAAMVADALHSLSDFATDVVVLICFRIIRKPADADHKYGHGKYETMATTLIGLALFAVGCGIFWSGSKSIWCSLHGYPVESPRPIALMAAVLSIVFKEVLYRYTVCAGRKIDSQAMIANAWHHRSDAFSSIGTLVGIGGAMALGPAWHILDPIAAVVVSLFIIKVSITISLGSIRELTEQALEDATEQEIISLTKGVQGTLDPHNLRTRRIGNTVAIDLHVRVDRNLTVAEAHTIACGVETVLRERFGSGTFVSIHIEPDKNDGK